MVDDDSANHVKAAADAAAALASGGGLTAAAAAAGGAALSWLGPVGTAIGAALGAAVAELVDALVDFFGGATAVSTFGQWLAVSRPDLYRLLQQRSPEALAAIDSDPLFWVPPAHRERLRESLRKAAGIYLRDPKRELHKMKLRQAIASGKIKLQLEPRDHAQRDLWARVRAWFCAHLGAFCPPAARPVGDVDVDVDAFDSLPPAAQAWIAARAARFGALALALEANNPAGLRCLQAGPHESHGCIAVAGTGRTLARFTTPEAGAVATALAALRATTPLVETWEPAGETRTVAGYRTSHPRPGELAGAEAAGVDDARALARIAELEHRAHQVGIWPFGPSEEAESRFRALLARWEKLEAEGAADVPNLRRQVERWRQVRDQWIGGDPDVTTLQELEADANLVARELADRMAARGKKPPPELDRKAELKGGTIDNATPINRAAAQLPAVEKAAAAAANAATTAANAAATAPPWAWAAGAGLAALVVVRVALGRVL